MENSLFGHTGGKFYLAYQPEAWYAEKTEQKGTKCISDKKDPLSHAVCREGRICSVLRNTGDYIHNAGSVTGEDAAFARMAFMSSSGKGRPEFSSRILPVSRQFVRCGIRRFCGTAGRNR